MGRTRAWTPRARGRRHGDDTADEVVDTGFRLHWLLTGAVLGSASWAVIGALVAAIMDAWMLAGSLVLVAVVAVALLLLAGRHRG